MLLSNHDVALSTFCLGMSNLITILWVHWDIKYPIFMDKNTKFKLVMEYTFAKKESRGCENFNNSLDEERIRLISPSA